MSSFIAKYRHKETGEIHNIYAMDDHFGSHEYGYCRAADAANRKHVMREKRFLELYERVAHDE